MPAGFAIWTADRRIPDDMVEQAAEIFAFDALALNADRRPDNPNCQWNGSTFAIFDHDLTLLADQVGTIFAPYPWTPGALDMLASGPGQHLMYNGLRTRAPTLDRLEKSWEAISDERLNQYIAALPESWKSSAGSVTAAVKYLNELRNHLAAAFQELRRVLS